MADSSDKRSPDEPNLELPSLFGRRRKKKARREAQPAETPPTETSAEDAAPAGPAPTRPAADDPAPAEGPAAAQESGQAVAEPAPSTVQPTTSGRPVPTAGGERRLPPTPPPSTPTAPEPAASEPVAPEATTPERPSEPAPTEPTLTDASTDTKVLQAPVPRNETEKTVASPGAETDELAAEQPAGESDRPRREPFRLPHLGARTAAIVTGVLVGLLAVVLTYAATRGCDAVRGIGNCGRVGLVAMLAILLVSVLVGSVLLKAWRLGDPTSTSLLAVGLVAVVVVLFFLGSIEDVWMLVVIPVLTAVAFLFSSWLTSTFVEGDPDVRR